MIGLQISAASTYAQLKTSDFTIFGGTGVQIGSSNTINGGSVGSYTLVQSTGNAAINSSINSGGKITLANSNVAGMVGGKITAANSASSAGTILSVGSSAMLKGNIDVNGNIVIGGGTVSGTASPGTRRARVHRSAGRLGPRRQAADPQVKWMRQVAGGFLGE